MNIRNVQQGMRAQMNQLGLQPGDPGLRKEDIIGPGRWIEIEPECPHGGTYTWLEGNFPLTGELVMRCSHQESHRYIPSAYADW